MKIEKKHLGIENPFWKTIVRRMPTLAGVLNLAFSFGGYVAGGFPRLLSRDFNRHIDFNMSDVDLWFRDITSLERFVLALKNNVTDDSDSIKFWIHESMAGLAYDVSFGGKHQQPDQHTRYKIQVVRCRIGEPEDVIASFDLRNCMIGFDREHVWEEPTRRALEDLNVIDVVNWNNPHLVSRVAKYFTQHNYRGFSEGKYEKFIEWLWNEYHDPSKNKVRNDQFKVIPGELQVSKKINLKEKTEEERQRALRCLIRQLVSSNVFSDSDLVLFMTVFAAHRDSDSAAGYGFIQNPNPALEALTKTQQSVQVEKVEFVETSISDVVQTQVRYYDPSYDYV